MSNWNVFHDAPRPTSPRRYGTVRANRAEQLVLMVARCPGLPAQSLAKLTGIHVQHVFKTLQRLACRGFVRCERRRTTVHGDTRERRVWFVTPIMRDLLDGRDHPGTVLGRIRTAMRWRPQTLFELTHTTATPADTLRTLLRLLVLQGDLVRVRHTSGERYGLPPVLDDDEDEPAVAA